MAERLSIEQGANSEEMGIREKVEKKSEKYSKLYKLLSELSSEAINQILAGKSTTEILESAKIKGLTESGEDKAIGKVALKKVREGLEKYQKVRDSVEAFKKEKGEKVNPKEIIGNIKGKENFEFGKEDIEASFVEGGIQLKFKNVIALSNFLGTTIKYPNGEVSTDQSEIRAQMASLDSFGYLLDKSQLKDEFSKEFLGDVIITFGSNSNNVLRHEQKEAAAGQFILEAQESKQVEETDKVKILREIVSDLAAKVEDGWEPSGLNPSNLGLDNIAKRFNFSGNLDKETNEILDSSQVYLENMIIKGISAEQARENLANLLRSTIINPADFVKIVETLVGKEIYEGAKTNAGDFRKEFARYEPVFLHELIGREMHSRGTLGIGEKIEDKVSKTIYTIISEVSSGSYGVVYRATRVNTRLGLNDVVYIKEATIEVSEHALSKPWSGGTVVQMKPYEPTQSIRQTIEIDFPRHHHPDLYSVIDGLSPLDFTAQRKAVDDYLNQQINDPLNPQVRKSRKDYFKDEIEKRLNKKHHEARDAREINLKYPNSVVEVHDSYTASDDKGRGNKELIIMAQAPGMLLEETIGQLGKLGYPPKERDAVEILIAFLEKIKGIHDNEMAHCDIKPGNLFIKLKRTSSGEIADQNGKPLDSLNKEAHIVVEDVGVIDLGNIVSEEMKKAGSGAGIGTPGYAPRELYVRGSGGEPATDIYALGVLMAGLLRKENFPVVDLLNDTDPEQAERLIFSVNQQISQQFHTILKKMLMPKPDERYTNATDLLKELEIYRNPYDKLSPFKLDFNFLDWYSSKTLEETQEYYDRYIDYDKIDDSYTPSSDNVSARVSFPTKLSLKLTQKSHVVGGYPSSYSALEQSDIHLKSRIDSIREALSNSQGVEICSEKDTTLIALADKNGNSEGFVSAHQFYLKNTRIGLDDNEATRRLGASMALAVHTFDIADKLVKEKKVNSKLLNSPCPITATMLAITGNSRPLLIY